MNVVIVWNTDYMGAILSLLREMGHDALDVNVARVSPLKVRHINVLGEYKFSLHPYLLEGDLRPLRDPNASIGFEIEEFNGEEGVSDEFIDDE